MFYSTDRSQNCVIKDRKLKRKLNLVYLSEEYALNNLNLRYDSSFIERSEILR